MNATHLGTVAADRGCVDRSFSPVMVAVYTLTYLVGVAGSVAALLILRRGASRNLKHAFMLRCLAWIDLTAVLGMLLQMYMKLYLPCSLFSTYWMCVLRVVWRVFGLGSGCVAVVMAVERYMALTHPFLYQRYVTYNRVRNGIFALWSVVLALVCLPFFGFGLYYHNGQCVRYKMATEPKDIAYAYLYCTFGALVCACIVWCNLAVIRVLCHLGCRQGLRGQSRLLSRRISRNSSRVSQSAFSDSTSEEVAFARLMGLLSVSFLVCWLPQLISIPIAQYAPKAMASRIFSMFAEGLIALHFALDPYLYVLFRHTRKPCLSGLLKVLCRRCSSSSNSKTSSLAMTDQEHCLSKVDSGEQQPTPV